MPTFPRGFANYLTNCANAELLEQLAREAGSSIADERSRLQMQHTAADWKTLRGLPAIGRGVSGAIAGSDPYRALSAKDYRRTCTLRAQTSENGFE